VTRRLVVREHAARLTVETLAAGLADRLLSLRPVASRRLMCRQGRLSATATAIVGALLLGACGEEAKKGSGIDPLPRATCGPVEYGGEGNPRALIASDLPMQGAARGRSEQMVEAIRLELERRDWRAGSLRVAFQPCDDSLARTGEWDKRRCQANARAYGEDRDLIGVVGTYNSGCAAAMLPTLNRAPGGGLAMVSPGNTLICLTKPSTTCEAREPERYFPTGRRTYTRVVPNDADQSAGLAVFAEQRELDRVYVLYAQGDPVSEGQATTFKSAARVKGLDVADTATWDPEARDYRRLMRQVKGARPDAILLAGLTEQNGGRLIKDKVAVVGDNDRVALLAADGFAQQSTIDAAGAAARGMFASTPGRAPASLPPSGGRFVKALRQRVKGGALELYAPYAGQAAAVLLDTIERAGKDRGQIASELNQTRIDQGIVGDFSFDRAGDTTLGVITVSRAKDEFSPATEIIPPRSLVVAARR
jgi:branched-chain amino acid transport system substrate-binding protein